MHCRKNCAEIRNLNAEARRMVRPVFTFNEKLGESELLINPIIEWALMILIKTAKLLIFVSTFFLQ